MTRQRLTLTAVTLAALALTAGSPAAARPATAGRAAPTTRGIAAPLSALEAGVRAALAGDYRLAVYGLWHDSLPAAASEWVRGPALAALRAAALTRLATGVRIRMLSAHQTVVSLTLNNARTAATAVVSAHELVQPSGPEGRPLGRTITLNEHGRFLLHRIGTTDRFVVWQVASLP